MRQRLAVLLLTAGIVTGCATAKGPRADAKEASPGIEPTVVGGPEFKDPLIRLNRAIFAFNDVTYRYLLIPVAKGYVRVMPEPARRGVGNVFHNIRTPIYVVNDILQLEPKPLGRHLSRFVINSTLGLAGLFDPARAWFGLERTETGFGETLADYGAGHGVYLVLPLYGSSDLRHSVGLVADFFPNPIPYLTKEPATTVIMAFDSFQAFAPAAKDAEILRRKAEDPYIFFRNLHLQGAHRDAGY